MKKCDRKDCGSWTNFLFDNKCRVTNNIPDGECPYFMDKDERKKLEKELKKARNEGMQANGNMH
ncbi:MAG: hypothetical protein CVU92_04710 [Firmicutes bacterium HGW-Firmicutes-17]|jgi:hypothetical protein|nr:MAG: hypothetical protein CVU92_04710 [Firmicutes bacterium HGW-Firmicutes-17]